MAIFVTGELVKSLRKRKGLQQSYMQKMSQNPKDLLVTLSRVENQKQQPSKETLTDFLDLLDMPYERVYCPEEDVLLTQQRALSSQAGEAAAAGKYEEALALSNEGLLLTFPEFDEATSTDDVLMFEEAALLHTRAKVYLHTNRRADALLLLNRIYAGLVQSLQTSPENHTKIPPIALTLAGELMQDGAHEQALEIINFGLRAAISHNMANLVPDFTQLKTQCLSNLGKKDEAALFEKYAQYTAEMVSSTVKNYSAPTLPFKGADNINIGKVIHHLRKQAGLSPKAIYGGLCTRDNYYKLEQGQYKNANHYLLASIFQRLGQDLSGYFTAFLSQEDMDDLVLSIEIIRKIAVENLAEAAELQEVLKTRKFAKTNYGKQFITMNEGIFLDTNNHYEEVSYNLFMEGLRLTLPHFDETKADTYRLTVGEVMLITQILMYLQQNKHYERAINLYAKMINNIRSINNRRVQDYYPLLLENLAALYNELERFDEALAMLKEAEAQEKAKGKFMTISAIAFHIAENLAQTNQKEEAKQYYTRAYYAAGLVGNAYVQGEAVKSAEKWGVAIET
ncbi:MAG: helix-turn-helix transcriptional regulator [Defluviitaleaceae bacterium]|nr:helix-turn-helix transcriptional regulator [Defluviitaleaceae bacterium]MCL2274892.1 helix-turn-helix transcriptional regulator [Defluviitaleaceae bacterium]